MKQLNLNGEIEDLLPIPNKKGGRPKKYPDMQQIHGYTEGEICGDCVKCFIYAHNGKNYYKCELKGDSRGPATDIRKRATACGLWKGESK